MIVNEDKIMDKINKNLKIIDNLLMENGFYKCSICSLLRIFTRIDIVPLVLYFKEKRKCIQAISFC